MNRRFTLVLLLAASVALALRCPQLGRRPMHNDEAVNAIKFGQLWEHGSYKYDPDEHHGPTLYYATLAYAWLTRPRDLEHVTETDLRLVTVLFGVGLIFLLPLVRDGLGRNGSLWAAFFTAISPAMVFYSGYYIHEILLVFFTLLALAAAWRYWRERKLGWALLAGGAVGLMDATKETFVLALAAAGLALAANHMWKRWLDASPAPAKTPRLRPGHLAAACGIWLAVALVFFSSFFANADGPLDSLKTYAPWLRRAGGDSPHIHPWYFYFQRLLFFHAGRGPIWSEALILCLAGLAALAGFTRRGLADASAGFVRFVALYTFALAAAYSLLAYKTPWCLLGFWHGTILLAGVGVVVLRRAIKQRWACAAVTTLLLAGAVQLAVRSWQSMGEYAADQRNPYVYAQTSPNLLELVHRLDSLAAVHPQGRQMPVNVIAQEGDCWPLPWYLRAYHHVNWMTNVPANPFASAMIVSSDFHANLDEKKTHLMNGLFALRPQVFFELYVELDLWRAYLAKNPPPRVQTDH
jgi:uncharacterized protein (TIGR03663 family)